MCSEDTVTILTHTYYMIRDCYPYSNMYALLGKRRRKHTLDRETRSQERLIFIFVDRTPDYFVRSCADLISVSSSWGTYL